MLSCRLKCVVVSDRSFGELCTANKTYKLVNRLELEIGQNLERILLIESMQYHLCMRYDRIRGVL